MKKTFFVTTPIYYVNARPHIGHVYTTVAADALARWHRARGREVFFLTGTDEHGEKIEAAAAREGLSPLEHATGMSEAFRQLWAELGISHDRFLRTTEAGHQETVRAIFSLLHRKGDIYRGVYEGCYCVSCGLHLSAPDGDTCPDCGRKAGRFSEDTWFFRLSAYRRRLLDHFEANPEFIRPDRIRDEVLNMLGDELPDLSLTRRCRWGVPLPGGIGEDPGMTIYVWFDALLNYLSALGYPLSGPEGPGRFWPPDIQLIGKDIIRFHHLIWPAILMAAGLPLPETVFAHGWWLTGREKMSKSRGNIVEPLDYSRLYGPDALRYFLLAEVPFGADGVFSDEAFRKRYNSDLANDLGNMVHRSLHLVKRDFAGRLPPPGPVPDAIAEMAGRLPASLSARMEAVDFHGFLEDVRGLVSAGNHYLDEKAPWRGGPEAGPALYTVIEIARICSHCLEPVMPAIAPLIRARLGEPEPPAGDPLGWGLSRAGTPVSPGEPVFPRIVAGAADRPG